MVICTIKRANLKEINKKEFGMYFKKGDGRHNKFYFPPPNYGTR